MLVYTDQRLGSYQVDHLVSRKEQRLVIGTAMLMESRWTVTSLEIRWLAPEKGLCLASDLAPETGCYLETHLDSVMQCSLVEDWAIGLAFDFADLMVGSMDSSTVAQMDHLLD